MKAKKWRRGLCALGALWVSMGGMGATAAAPAPSPPAREAWAAVQAPVRQAGIWGWGLVGAGFLGVALTAARPPKPRKKRRLVPVAGALRRPIKLGRSPYTPPPGRKYRHGSRRRQ